MNAGRRPVFVGGSSSAAAPAGRVASFVLALAVMCEEDVAAAVDCVASFVHCHLASGVAPQGQVLVLAKPSLTADLRAAMAELSCPDVPAPTIESCAGGEAKGECDKLRCLLMALQRAVQWASSRGANLLWLTPWSLVREDPFMRVWTMTQGKIAMMAEGQYDLSAAMLYVPAGQFHTMSWLLEDVRTAAEDGAATGKMERALALSGSKAEAMLDALLCSAVRRTGAQVTLLPSSAVAWAARGMDMLIARPGACVLAIRH